MGGSFSSVGGRVRPHFAVFRVQGAPIITSNLDEGGALREGDTIQLAVTVDGVTPITYEWFKDGVSIPGATGDSLALGPLSEGDNGVYHVRVSNGNGYLLSRQFTVLVQAPPSVSNTALNLTEEIGETVQLTVSALGGGELQYEWYKNNALIPGETGTTLILSNLQPLDSGEYGVKVFNDVGTVRALIANLDVQFESVVQLRDDFLPFIPLQNVPSGIARGSNEGAGLETNEPVHGNKRSAGSIWLTWKAPSTGLVTFDTEGSNFDTLLAVYTGNTLAELIEIKAADDKRNDDVVNGRGRVKYSSEISFNAEAGSDYHIAVVGFSGERGDVVINWMFEEEENLPDFDEKGNRKITIARGFTQRLNGRANVFGGVYAWYHNGRLLADETGPELELVNIGDTEVGIYTVEVQRGGGGKKARKDFCVEIGASLGVNTENKLQDLDLPTGVLNRFGIEKRNIAIVTVGTLGTQVTDIYGSSVQGGEIAGAQNGSSRWFRLQPDDPGLMRVNTAGSTFENTLTIYTLKDESKDLAFTNLDFLTSDSSGLTSEVHFRVEAGKQYVVTAAGADGNSGCLSFNWILGEEPEVTVQPVGKLATVGQAVEFSVDASPASGLQYQWYLNGSKIEGATGKNYSIPMVDFIDTGDYQVIVSNEFGFRVSGVANLGIQAFITPEFYTETLALNGGVFSFQLVTSPNAEVIVEYSETMLPGSWMAITPGTPQQADSEGVVTVMDTGAASSDFRFYRVRAVDSN